MSDPAPDAGSKTPDETSAPDPATAAPAPSGPVGESGRSAGAGTGTKLLAGVAVLAILAGVALVVLPWLSDDDGVGSDALPETWPPGGDESWAVPVENAEGAACGAGSVGLLIDRSVPVDPGHTVPNLSGTIAAATTYVESIGLTPTPVGFWSFGTYSDPMGDAEFAEPDGVVDFPAAVPAVVAGVEGNQHLLELTNGLASIPFGFTSAESDQVELSERNWEAGLRAVADSGAAPDTLVMITTGSPTTHDADSDLDKGVGLDDIDAAVVAANELKAAGTRIVVVSVEGSDAMAAEAISGPVRGDLDSLDLGDVYAIGRDELTATLEQVAAAQCGGTVTFDKRVQELVGADPMPGPGWNFRLTAGDQPVDDGASDEAGLVMLAWQDQEAVTLLAEGRDGYQLPLDAGGSSESGASCRRGGGDGSVVETEVPGGIEIAVDPSEILGCTYFSVRSYVDLAVELLPSPEVTPPGTSIEYEVSYRNAGTTPSAGTVVQFVVPEGATVAAADNRFPWRCAGGFPAMPGTSCTYAHQEDLLEARSPFYVLPLIVRVDAGTERTGIEARALIVAEGAEDAVPDNNLFVVTSPTSADAPPPTTVPPPTTPPTTPLPPTTVAPTTAPPTTTSTVPPTTTTAPPTTTTAPPATTTTVPPTTAAPTTQPPTTQPPITVPPTTVPPPTTVLSSDDLAVAITTPAVDAAVGDFVDFTVTATNEGDRALSEATLSIVPPPGTQFDVRTSQLGWRCDRDASCSFELGEMGAGESISVGMVIRFAVPAGRDSIRVDVAIEGVSPGGTLTSTGAAVVTLATVDLAVELEVIDAPVGATTARYRATIHNNGSAPATQVELDIDLPDPLQIDSLTGSDAASCLRTSGRCEYLTLAPGATEVVEAAWRIPRTLPTASIVVAASVSGQLAEATPSDNEVAVETAVEGITVEPSAPPSGLLDSSDTSSIVGVVIAIVVIALLAWIIAGAGRGGRRRDNGDPPEDALSDDDPPDDDPPDDDPPDDDPPDDDPPDDLPRRDVA